MTEGEGEQTARNKTNVGTASTNHYHNNAAVTMTAPPPLTIATQPTLDPPQDGGIQRSSETVDRPAYAMYSMTPAAHQREEWRCMHFGRIPPRPPPPDCLTSPPHSVTRTPATRHHPYLTFSTR